MEENKNKFTNTSLKEQKTPICAACGSPHTEEKYPIRFRPNILIFILVGWIYLLARSAFYTKTIICNDCGKSRKYKSIWSWICLALFSIIILLIYYSGE